MAGGIGSRFWPLSKTALPKQFLDILGTGRTLIQQTYDRFLPICPKENIIVVTNEQYIGLVAEQLPDLQPHQILGEPARRNTAPCIAYASFKIQSMNPEANIIVAPSDHLILKEENFLDLVKTALNFTAKRDALVTLGIKPSRPDTGYGYIQFTDDPSVNDPRIKKVKTFTEKPNLSLAKDFLVSGDFYWNSGIFIWSVSSILKAFDQHLAEVGDLFKEGASKYNTPEEKEFIDATYPVCSNISIDYGVMEKAKNVNVVLGDFGWSDLGTYGSLYTHLKQDKEGNAIIGKKALIYDSGNNIVNVPDDKLVVLVGVEDSIVVESDGVLMICKKTEEQKIKQVVNDLKISHPDTV